MEKICNNILYLFHIASQNSEDDELKDLLENMYDRILDLRVRVNKETIEIAFVGKSNVGKSTLMNAVFGENVAPKRNGPYTAAVVEYRYGDKYSILLKKPDRVLVEIVSCDSPDELYGKLKAESTVSETADFAEAERIIVKLPSKLLKAGVVFYDTPGFGATKGENNDMGIHDGIVKSFLESQCCDQIFWIFRGDNPTRAELDFVKEYTSLYEDCNRLIVNVDEDDMPIDFQNKYKAKYLSDIKSLQGHVLFINAKNAEDAKKLQKKLEEYSANCHEYEKVLSVLLKRFCVHCSDFIHRYPVWDSCILAKIERLVKELNKNYLEETIIALKKLDKSIK